MRLETHDAVLGSIPLRAETVDDAIKELQAGETVQRAWLRAGAPEDWCTQIFDVYAADTGEELAVSIDMECWDVTEEAVERARAVCPRCGGPMTEHRKPLFPADGDCGRV